MCQSRTCAGLVAKMLPTRQPKTGFGGCGWYPPCCMNKDRRNKRAGSHCYCIIN